MPILTDRQKLNPKLQKKWNLSFSEKYLYPIYDTIH
nr:MAG TPA: hypothetical protein [Caudoviricetes sp.]